MKLILDTDFKNHLNIHKDIFDQVMKLEGEIFRQLENRRTQKIRIGQNNYFIKQHYGVGWKEIFKNLFQLRLPVISAKNEWLALKSLKTLNIATQDIIGYGVKGCNPARLQSFLITLELPSHITLEDMCKNWKNKPAAFPVKQKLLLEVARIAKTIHQHGINHRDFYLCHFLLPVDQANNKLYLIDLHRAQIRKKIPERWIIKDLAGLYFSSKDAGLTLRDYLRFIKAYRNKPLRETLIKEDAFWKKVKKRGDKLYQQHAN